MHKTCGVGHVEEMEKLEDEGRSKEQMGRWSKERSTTADEYIIELRNVT